MNLRWFVSKTYRHARALRKHVRNLLSAQRDILTAPAVHNVATALEEFSHALRNRLKKEDLMREMEKLDQVATKWLKPYPHHAWRENVEVFLVAIAVAMGIRTFFLQPFKIPTGSMQPTLFGITSVPDFSKVTSREEAIEQARLRDALHRPSGWESVKDWFGGVSYLEYQAEEDGAFEGLSRPLRFLLFNLKQTIWVGGKPQNLWFPPDSGGAPTYHWGNFVGYLQAIFSPLPVDDSYPPPDLERRMGLRRGQPFTKGEDILKIQIVAGDHLFVDRLTYNFRKPRRGEIAVFATAGTRIPQQDQFYIKRLVAMGGERVQIGDDRHLIINGHRLDASTPHFEKVYSFDPNKPPHESEFSGHVNETVATRMGRPHGLAPLFPNQDEVVTLPPDTYMVMGDNTLNSFDSRAWGEFPASNIIGREFFVYWPLSKRFGWGNR